MSDHDTIAGTLYDREGSAHIVKAYSAGRVCAWVEKGKRCTTKLSIYNDGDMCAKHHIPKYPSVRGERKKAVK